MKRVPPGDRWDWVDSKSSEPVAKSLTIALAMIYKKDGTKKFVVDAGLGFVSVDDGNVAHEEVVEKQLFDDLYDEG